MAYTVKLRDYVVAREKKIARKDPGYYKELDSILDQLFEDAAKKRWTWQRLAAESKLSYSTVLNLGNRVTRFPRFKTVLCIARALGQTLKLTISGTKRRAASARAG